MIYLENFKIAISSLWAHKVRAFLTVLGILIGVFSVIMVIALVTGLKDDIRSMIVSLGGDVLDIVPMQTEGFHPGQMTTTFEEKDIEALKERSDLYKYISEVYEFGGTFEYKDKQVIGFGIGVEPSYFKIREKQAQVGNLFEKSEHRGAKRLAVIGSGVAEKLFSSLERSLGKKIKINGKEFEVTGVLEEEDFKMGGFDINDATYIPSTTADQTFSEARFSEIFVKLYSEAEVKSVTKEIESILNKVRGKDKFSIMAQEDMLEVVNQVTGLIAAALVGLASISLLVGGIGIMNIMLVSVTERTKEIGIRKAVGADERHILIQFLTEAIALTLLGGVAGLGLVSAVSVVINKYTGISSLINWQTVLGSVGFSVLVGVVFGTAPALRASRLDPIEALRYE